MKSGFYASKNRSRETSYEARLFRLHALWAWLQESGRRKKISQKIKPNHASRKYLLLYFIYILHLRRNCQVEE